jgi:periplasmic protein CpxP/Spy
MSHPFDFSGIYRQSPLPLWRGLTMTYAIDRLACSVATAGILSVLVVGSPTAIASPWHLAQATPAPSPAAPSVSGQTPQTPSGGNAAAPSPRRPTVRVESSISDLRTKLQITAAEEPQFNALADVMRANAQSMEALLQERGQDTNRTAVDALQWYERLADAHAAALKKFVPAFDALYATLSDSQKKTADAMFQRFAERPPPRRR